MLPKKFKKLTKSSLAKLTPEHKKNRTASFSVFPQDVNYFGMEDDEHIVLVVRKSKAAMLKPIFYAISVFLLAALALYFVVHSVDNKSDLFLAATAALLVLLMLAFNMLLEVFVKWFYTIHIITDERVVDVDFVNMLYHKYSEAQLEHIEDVSHKVSGLLGSIFDFGTVYIQTAGARPEIAFEDIPRPRDAQDILHDLIELKQEGKI